MFMVSGAVPCDFLAARRLGKVYSCLQRRFFNNYRAFCLNSPFSSLLLMRHINPFSQSAVSRAIYLGMSEIIFEVSEDETDGGYVATALGHAIATQGETVEELREMVRDAVRCHFGDGAAGPMPKIIRLHFVRDEALAV